MKTKLLYGVAAVILVALLAVAGCSNPLSGGSGASDRHATAAVTDSGDVAPLSDDPVEIELLTAKDKVAGTLNVTNDSENLYVEFLPSEQWCIVETHVHVANTLDDFALVGRWKTPAPGLFDFKTDHDCEPPYEYTIALGDLDVQEDLIIAAHAKLSDGEVTETAWAAGTRFSERGNWATYFTYSLTFMLDLDVFPEGKGAVAGQGRYPAGADVTIEATPADHWQFVNWTEGDEVLGTDAVQSYTMPARDHTLTANFEPILYELTLLVEPSDGGEVSGAGSYTFGQEIELTATAYDGYVFVKWVDEDGEQVSDVPDFSFIMPGMGTTLTAVLQTAVPQDLDSPIIGTLRYVPGGTYQRDDDPENTTTVSQFYMSVHQITQAQFLDIMGDPSDTTRSTGTDDPVQWVNWYDAIAFCNKLSLAEGKQLVYGVTGITDWGALEYDDIPTTSTATWNEATMDMDADGYRLPTEAEWMWAAMGADMEPDAMQAGINRTGYLKPFAGYDGTNSLGDYAVYRGNSGPGDTNEEPRTTRPVGSKLPNELGLYDMSGNVWDWTWDWKADYPSYSLTDPTGPPSGTYRVVRGGSWGSFASGCAVAYRFGYFPHYRYYGFRVVSR